MYARFLSKQGYLMQQPEMQSSARNCDCQTITDCCFGQLKLQATVLASEFAASQASALAHLCIQILWQFCRLRICSTAAFKCMGPVHALSGHSWQPSSSLRFRRSCSPVGRRPEGINNHFVRLDVRPSEKIYAVRY